ncbi:ABC transporter substrate-binding protein [Alicyclobacillus fodiniaquatilis]|uniref:ABC transporter substrate-binding protein n=1 Tax=Alicyclobacillus fodiniaquatilis TaxID=1661150 RepID=A0ABW4JPV0_9BACL
MQMTNRRVITGVFFACLAVALTGCGTTDAKDSSNHTVKAASADAHAITVTDGTGAKVTLQKPATSFVCLDPSAIEMLKDLGEKDIAYDNGDQLFVKMVFGSYASKLKQIGGSWEQPNVEDILADHPDLVIGDAYPHAEIKPALKGVAPMYLISRSGGYKQSMQDFVNLGVLTGHKATAERDVKAFMQDLHTSVKASPKNETSLIIWGDSPTDFEVPTVDDPSASVLAAISKYPWGGKGAQGMNLSLDKILQVNPDVIFVESIAKLDNPKAPTLSSQLASNPLWAQLKAVKDHHVYEVNPEVWHSDRGGLGLEKILDQAMQKMYPSLHETK